MRKPSKKTKRHSAVAVQRGVRRLIVKYENNRVKYYRWATKATKRKDIDGQVVYGVMQMCYTEMQTDLERLLEPSNAALCGPDQGRRAIDSKQP